MLRRTLQRLLRITPPHIARAALIIEMADGQWHTGLDLMRACCLRSSRLYPLLANLEREGRVEAMWLHAPGHDRRVYRLTPEQDR